MRQILALGFSRGEVATRVRASRLHRRLRGVVAVGHGRITQRGRWMAGVLASGPEALLSHGCAAVLRGLMDRPPAIVEVTAPHQVRRRKGIRCHLFAALEAGDRDIVDGIPCASVALTLLGLAATAPDRLPGALAQAEKHGVLDLAAIRELLVRTPRAAGRRALRHALDGYRLELDWTESELERRAFALFAEAGLPPPRVRAWIEVAGDGFEVDFNWPDRRLVVEVDGFGSHGDRLSFERDRRRDGLLVAAGWRVIRFTWRQVVDDPAFVVTTIRAVLANAPAAGRP